MKRMDGEEMEEREKINKYKQSNNNGLRSMLGAVHVPNHTGSEGKRDTLPLNDGLWDMCPF